MEAAVALIKNKFTRDQCKRPASADCLYSSAYIHLNDGEQCTKTCATDMQAIVDRSKWSRRSGDPMVFRGVVASADGLMKDALVRDRWSREKDVLCFEMEAAGMAHDFP